MSVRLRPATPSDRDSVWRLNNDPSVRAQAIRREPIPLDEHRAWFARKLADPRCAMWIAEAEGEAIGVVRIDGERGRPNGAISIALAPPARGRGLGRIAIADATRAWLARRRDGGVVALIRPDNARSARAFERAGYLRAGSERAGGSALLRYRCTAAGSAAQVLLRCDGGASIGWGHAIRCSALAAALREAGLESVMAMREPDAGLLALLEDGGQRVLTIEDREETASAVAALQATGARWLVLDSYRLGGEYLDAVRAHADVRSVVVDDSGDRPLCCEVLVNGNPGAERLGYGGYSAALRLLGPQYALLRGEFAPERRPRRRPDAECPTVLTTLGGSRLGTAAVELARAVDALPRPLRIALLVGTSDPDAAEAARRFAGAAQHAVEVHGGTRRMAELLARTTLAVSAAGTTCFELAATGVPALLLVAADNQRRGAAAWHELGAFEALGELTRVEPAHVAARVDELLDDETTREALGRRAAALVAGDGAQRVARAIVSRG